MITVVVPSRIARNPESAHEIPGGVLFLDGALGTIKAQTRADLIKQVVIAVDPGRKADVPARFLQTWCAHDVVEAPTASQASALNAGVAVATQPWIAFLEDDDQWRNGNKIETQVKFTDRYDLITCNQEEVSTSGGFERVNDFPTPSGWLVRAEKLPRFDESFRWHVDTEMLGQLKRAGARRIHICAPSHGTAWIQHISHSSDIHRINGSPMVVRRNNPGGGMAKIASDAEAGAQSKAEHEEMARRYADLFPKTQGIPW